MRISTYLVLLLMVIAIYSCNETDPRSESTTLTKEEYKEAFMEEGINLDEVQFDANENSDDPEALHFESKEELVKFLKEEVRKFEETKRRSQARADSLLRIKKKNNR